MTAFALISTSAPIIPSTGLALWEVSASLTCTRSNNTICSLFFFHLSISMRFLVEMRVSILVAPAPAAFISDASEVNLKSSILSKLTQVFEAPVSKINRPFTPFILAVTSKWLVSVITKGILMYFFFFKNFLRDFIQGMFIKIKENEQR